MSYTTIECIGKAVITFFICIAFVVSTYIVTKYSIEVNKVRYIHKNIQATRCLNKYPPLPKGKR